MGKNMKKRHVCNRITLLYTRNQDNTVNQLHFGKIKFKKPCDSFVMTTVSYAANVL